MRRIIVAVTRFALMLVASLCWSCSSSTQPEMVKKADMDSRRDTTLGEVVGYADKDETHAWLCIPFAQPPVGNGRWRAPLPSKPWLGTRESLKFCEPCIQFGGFASAVPEDQHGHVVGSEDCLYLNVWAPRFSPDNVPQGTNRLPVMVWVHGGGNSTGTAATYRSLHTLAGLHKLVVVSVNYRLGLMGWFYHDALWGKAETAEDRSGNYGILDLIQALRWVRDNIGAFGGDPANVTVFGESAGGANVYALLASSQAKGLFQRAIVQSGILRSFSLAEAGNFRDDPVPGHPRSSREIMNDLLVADGLAKDRTQAKAYQTAMDTQAISDYLRGKPPKELLAPFRSSIVSGYGMYFPPVIFRDGAVQPEQLKPGLFADISQYNSVPVIIGSNRDEYKLFMSQNPELVGKLLWLIPRIRDVQTYNRATGYFSDLWKALGVDMPAAIIRAAQGPSVYAYRFDWDEQPDSFLIRLRDLLGACHGLDLCFIDGLMDPNRDPFHSFSKENEPGRKALARAMTSYWVEFAYHGAPGRGRAGDLPEWKSWDNGTPESDKFVVFDTEAGGGIRMASETITEQDIKDRLLRDQNLIGSQRELCRLYARLFKYSFHSADQWDEAEYESFGKEGCKECPPESFR
jgi:para-nitrobenzyl esterase